jgi:hypothetical protein
VSTRAVGWLCALVVALGFLISSYGAARAQTTPHYYDQQLLNYKFSEFCASVGKPPAPLAEALNQAVTQDPKTWLPVVQWWNKIAEKYAEAKCGDA